MSRLKEGMTISCGCVNREKNKIPESEKIENHILKEYRRGAVTRGLEWSITKEEAIALVRGDCFYCGSPAKEYNSPRNANFIRKSNGIDRYNNDKGYISGNVVSCCYLCNKMKSNLTAQEFLLKIKQINTHLNK